MEWTEEGQAKEEQLKRTTKTLKRIYVAPFAFFTVVAVVVCIAETIGSLVALDITGIIVNGFMAFMAAIILKMMLEVYK